MSLEGKRLPSSTVFIFLCATALHSVSGPRQPSRAPAQSIWKQSAIKCMFSHLDNMARSAARASRRSQGGAWCNFAPYCCNTPPHHHHWPRTTAKRDISISRPRTEDAHVRGIICGPLFSLHLLIKRSPFLCFWHPKNSLSEVRSGAEEELRAALINLIKEKFLVHFWQNIGLFCLTFQHIWIKFLFYLLADLLGFHRTVVPLCFGALLVWNVGREQRYFTGKAVGKSDVISSARADSASSCRVYVPRRNTQTHTFNYSHPLSGCCCRKEEEKKDWGIIFSFFLRQSVCCLPSKR